MSDALPTFRIRTGTAPVGELASDDARYDVAHAVILSKLFVLVPGRVFPALGRPLANFVGLLQAVGQKKSAAAPGDDLPRLNLGITPTGSLVLYSCNNILGFSP